MNQRIRYEKLNPESTQYGSVKLFNHPTNGARYRVTLNLTESKWYVVNDVTDLVEASGSQTNLNKMKQEARTALEQLGVELTKEERTYKNKTNTTTAST